MFSARNRVFARSLIAVTSWPKIVDLALVGVEDAGDDREQRRLAAARRADEQRHLPRVDVPVDPAQGLHPLLARAEVLGHAPDPDRDLVRRRGRRADASSDGRCEHRWRSLARPE